MQDVSNHLLLLCCEFWWLSLAELDCHDAERPDVDSIFISASASFDELRGHPAHGSYNRLASLLTLLKLARKAEVAQLHSTCRVHQNVVALDVPVDD